MVVLIGAFFYLLLSGVWVPTQRGFFLIAIVMVAILLDRQAISMRLVGWAAIVILALQPESLLSASFEM
jgi:competence protein ComEC